MHTHVIWPPCADWPRWFESVSASLLWTDCSILLINCSLILIAVLVLVLKVHHLGGYLTTARKRLVTRCESHATRAYWDSKYWFTTYFLQPLPYPYFSYAIGSTKLSANEQFFVGAQTVVSLLQTTQITSDVCFITDHGACASSNKTKIVWIFFFFFYPGWMRRGYVTIVVDEF